MSSTRMRSGARPPSGDGSVADPSGWTPAEIARALDVGGDRYEHLARTLLPMTATAAGQELYPFGAHYDRNAADLRHDVTQDVMVKLFANGGRVLRAWEPQLGLSLRGFIKRVVRFHVLQLFRTERSNPWRNDPAEPEQLDGLDPRPPELLHQLWLWQVRDQLLERETERGRKLYQALFVEQRAAEDIARDHDMTRDAVYQWRARFKRRAAKTLGNIQRTEGEGAPHHD
ncbi:MAG: sigma-70 family RNA polymerase sigma factor [Myxococcota bacterium]